jgi:hypothetical protein
MNSYYHAEASARKWGGDASEYQAIHDFIDSSKEYLGDVRHRALYHHTGGIWLCQRLFGTTITVARGSDRPREVPVRLIAELHIEQDLGWIPSPNDYWENMELKQWMGGPVRTVKPLSDFFPVKEEV